MERYEGANKATAATAAGGRRSGSGSGRNGEGKKGERKKGKPKRSIRKTVSQLALTQSSDPKLERRDHSHR